MEVKALQNIGEAGKERRKRNGSSSVDSHVKLIHRMTLEGILQFNQLKTSSGLVSVDWFGIFAI